MAANTNWGALAWRELAIELADLLRKSEIQRPDANAPAYEWHRYDRLCDRRRAVLEREADGADECVVFQGSSGRRRRSRSSMPLSMFHVHDPANCEGRGCPIHHPSDHHMREWSLNWRNDRKLMERICPHGVGHPDPDDINPDHIHGCDGCCSDQQSRENTTYREVGE